MRFIARYLKSNITPSVIQSPQKPIVELFPFLQAGLALSLLLAFSLLALAVFAKSIALISSFRFGYFGFSIFITLILGIAFGFRYSINLYKKGFSSHALEISVGLLYLPFLGAIFLGIWGFYDSWLYFPVVIFVFSSLFLNLKCLKQQTIYLLLIFGSAYTLDSFATAALDQPPPSPYDLLTLSSVVILLNMVLQRIIKHFQAHAADLIAQKQINLNYQLGLEATVNERTLELITEKNIAIQESMAKSQFLANMSHELRTPLNAIIGYAELIQEEINESASKEIKFVVKDVSRIHSAGRNLLELVNNVLDFSKLEANQTTIRITKLNVAEIIYDAASLINPLLSKTKNELYISPIHESLVAYGDHQKLKQVLINLLSNANKFTNKGSIIVSVEEYDLYLSISIADTGVGIKPEQLDQLFKPFSQIENNYSGQFDGTGLGLAISKKFMELMNGTIEVQSVFEQGSIFTINVAKYSSRKQLNQLAPGVVAIG